ncbi:FAD assembly factor SdhE [Bibersteinia trehalosi]|uniref:FAD assembly factor SdhE n=1 Tax=Bibersteinia trehalosi TaxID=47735 RepID=UPI0010504DDC|nr:succinate dehydrogenase assembly factor 2 [Bibersteinia trehalosi]
MMELNRFRIEWDCRRGMRELDKLIMPFYQKHFDELDESQQQTFVVLLGYTDPELYRWFMNQLPAPTAELQAMVRLIQQKLEY